MNDFDHYLSLLVLVSKMKYENLNRTEAYEDLIKICRLYLYKLKNLNRYDSDKLDDLTQDILND